ncbi:hypothetical protein ACPCA8_09785 [Streptomyces capoamus]
MGGEPQRGGAGDVRGTAMEVPEMVLVAVSLVFQADVMDVPGAKRSVQGP